MCGRRHEGVVRLWRDCGKRHRNVTEYRLKHLSVVPRPHTIWTEFWIEVGVIDTLESVRDTI